MKFEKGWLKRQVARAVVEIREWSPSQCAAFGVDVPKDSNYVQKERVLQAAQRFVREQGSFASERNLRDAVEVYNKANDKT